MSAVSTDRWTCPRCQRTTVVTSTSVKDTAAALDAVRTRHGEGHVNGVHNLDAPPASPRSTSRARRASTRAADRRRKRRAA